MKKILAPFIISFALISCDETEDKPGNSLIEKSEKINQDSQAKADSIAKYNDEHKEPVYYVSLWNKTSLRISDPKGFKWSPTKVNYGRSMEFLKDSTVGKKKYALVKLVSGKSGWINEWVVAKDAKAAIVISPANIYSAPDPLELTKNKLNLGDIVVVYNEQIGDYVEFVTEEKKTKGYLKASGAISTEVADIESGIAFGHILNSESASEKKIALEEFLENESYKSSVFGTKAQKMLDEGIEEEIVETLIDSVSNGIETQVKDKVSETLEETIEDLGL